MTYLLDHVHQFGFSGVLSEGAHDSSQFLCCDGAWRTKKTRLANIGIGRLDVIVQDSSWHACRDRLNSSAQQAHESHHTVSRKCLAILSTSSRRHSPIGAKTSIASSLGRRLRQCVLIRPRGSRFFVPISTTDSFLV
jgi:hypothetical protein